MSASEIGLNVFAQTIELDPEAVFLITSIITC